MSKYHEVLAAAMFGEEPTTYGWIIDRDHVADEGAEPGTNANAVGVMGPRDIPADLQARLEKGEGRKFKMYDDDNELYYSGRLVQSEGEDDLGDGPSVRSMTSACPTPARSGSCTSSPTSTATKAGRRCDGQARSADRP